MACLKLVVMQPHNSSSNIATSLLVIRKSPTVLFLHLLTRTAVWAYPNRQDLLFHRAARWKFGAQGKKGSKKAPKAKAKPAQEAIPFYFPLSQYNPNINPISPIKTLLYYSSFHFIFHYAEFQSAACLEQYLAPPR